MEKKLQSEIVRICNSVITKHDFGAKISNSARGKIPRFLITDYRALGTITGIVRYYVHKEQLKEQIFYRGQRKEWILKPSLYRCCDTKEKLLLAEQWRAKSLAIVKEEKFDFDGTDDEREAMAQHYGLATSFIDVVDHIQTALWFAYDGMTEEESVGYIYILSVPQDKATVIDLRNKPSKWLRPHTQQAFCFRMKHVKELGKISERYHIMTLVIPKDLLRLWSNYDVVKKEYMYPPDQIDSGADFWKKAEKRLKEEGLGIKPEEWIQQELERRKNEIR